ncbi:MAG: HAD-IIIA family hydrolase [Candidatus Omnitrophica bacterium]|nr:HAD-IIIA family hydrolase [Candidatus Omnitrophota bacterium]
MISGEVTARAKKVKFLILDIDGVMTDGRIIYSIYGDELKFFDVQDGFGITLLNAAGIKSVIITAKKSKVVRARARDMNIAKTYQGFSDKLIPYEDMLKKFNASPDEICFMGDDLVDLPVLKRVGFGVAVSNAVEEVKKNAHYVTTASGGRGAVREVCDLILKTQGKWDAAISKYAK